ncbi:MAG: hypothetical protein KF833_16840 [Verrucomicrobiae bacterium]|nr:hypothetical protein [Verrucomicrobiae bacterium]
MSAEPRIALLLAEIDQGRSVMERIAAFYREQAARWGTIESRTTEQAIVLADVLVTFYTCLETVFVRISQHFENSLAREKWHRELLDRMSLEVPGIRARAIGPATRELLDELLRFRHFKRYYFEFHYDWDRLEFVRRKFEQALPLLSADLDRFAAFLRELSNRGEAET